MVRQENSEINPEDVRVEYQTSHAYYAHTVATRFTIAAFYLAGVGLLAQVRLSSDSAWSQRLAASSLGIVIGLWVWILELRTRTLYSALARRLVEIERTYWYRSPQQWLGIDEQAL